MEMLEKVDLVEKTAAEIRADKQAWLDRKARNREKLDIASQNYRDALDNLFKPIKDNLTALLSKYNLLQLDIYVDRYWGEGVEVRVQCAERSRDDSTSLRWDYKAILTSGGELKKETGSWSGLQACTSDQIANLKQCVAALEDLNNIDWVTMLTIKEPDYKDYRATDLEDDTKEYDYDTELKIAQLSELMGQDKVIEFYHPKLDKMFWGKGNKYLKVNKLTNKMVRGHVYVKQDSGFRDTSYDDQPFTIDGLRLYDNIYDI